jgi:hypothetical protein
VVVVVTIISIMVEVDVVAVTAVADEELLRGWSLTKRPAILRALDPAFHGQLDQLLADYCMLLPAAATDEQHRLRPPTNKKMRVSAVKYNNLIKM